MSTVSLFLLAFGFPSFKDVLSIIVPSFISPLLDTCHAELLADLLKENDKHALTVPQFNPRVQHLMGSPQSQLSRQLCL